MTKKVCFLTTFYEADSGYSLIGVCENQLRMLLKNGYDPIVLVRDNFETHNPFWQSHVIDIRPVLPGLDSPPEQIATILKDHLSDVIITHDIFLLPDYKNYAAAIRQLESKNIVWLHYLHSAPSGQIEAPQGYFIYPNFSDKSRVCQVYGLSGQEWRVIPNRASHSIDPLLSWKYDLLTSSLMDKFNLLEVELPVIYPARLDRGKQPEKIIRLLAGIKKASYSTKLLIVDWQSAGSKFQLYMDELEELANNLGVEIAFTSRLDDRCNQGVSRHVVTELLDLSTIYIHPSKSETYSLVVHEALLRGKLVVLNYDFPVMLELFGENAIYMDFGSDKVQRTYNPDEQSFWNEEAKRLIAEYKQNRALMAQSKARRQWSPQVLFKEFEPLLYLSPC